jgi:methyl halide transferase
MSNPVVNGWEDLWARGIKPGDAFDKRVPSPALAALIQADVLPESGSALVAGCGRGYECQLLARSEKYGRVVGLDLAETAIASARTDATENGIKQGVGKGMLEFVCDDFFKYPGVKEGFQLAFDYVS